MLSDKSTIVRAPCADAPLAVPWKMPFVVANDCVYLYVNIQQLQMLSHGRAVANGALFVLSAAPRFSGALLYIFIREGFPILLPSHQTGDLPVPGLPR